MASPTPSRTSARERRAKQFNGYVPASFSEKKESMLSAPPSPPATLVGTSGRYISNDSISSLPAKKGPPKRIPHPRQWKPNLQNLINFSQWRSSTWKPTTVPGIPVTKNMIDVTKKAAAALRQSAAMPGLPGYKNVSNVAKKMIAANRKSAARLTKMAVVSGLPNRPKTKIAGANKGNFPNVEDQNVSSKHLSLSCPQHLVTIEKYLYFFFHIRTSGSKNGLKSNV